MRVLLQADLLNVSCGVGVVTQNRSHEVQGESARKRGQIEPGAEKQ